MLVSIIVSLILVGVLLYVVNDVIPMPDWVKKLINVIAMVVVLVWLLDVFGVYHTNLRLLK